MKMRSIIFFTGFFACTAVWSQVPVLHDRQLKLDQLVTYSGTRAHYYRNVVLQMERHGRLRIRWAEARPLAQVDELELTQFQGPAASVYASGFLSEACVALEEPAVLREGSTFVVVLAETVMEPDEVCMSLVAVTPFGISVPLPLTGLEAGEYAVRVNNAVTSFILTQDQDQP